MKKVLAALFLVGLLATVSQATVINSFVNADFDSGIVTTGNGSFAGFDAPAAPEIIGWSNYGTVNDAGVEASGAWWIIGYADQNCAFVNGGGGASNMSSYVIQDGDQFTASLISDAWWNVTTGQVMLWYDNPTNVIGSFDFTPTRWSFGPFSNATPITATSASVGHTLGLTVFNTGSAIITFDEVTVNVASVPEPCTFVMLGLGGLALLAIRRRK